MVTDCEIGSLELGGSEPLSQNVGTEKWEPMGPRLAGVTCKSGLPGDLGK